MKLAVNREQAFAFESLTMFIVLTWTRYSYGGFRETSETTEFDLDFSAGLKQEGVVIVDDVQLDQ